MIKIYRQSSKYEKSNCYNIDNIKEVIDTCITDYSYAEGRKNVLKETWEYKGQGAVRTVDYLINKYNEILSKEEK